MAVISGIIQAAKIAIKVAPVAFRAGKFGYKVAGKTKHGAKWIRQHPKIIKAGTVAAGAGGLILDLTNIDYSSLVPPTKPGKIGQTRKYVYGASNGRFYNQKRKHMYCRPNVRKRQYS